MSYQDLEQIAKMEKDKDEDEKLKQQAVTYTSFDELADFEGTHAFKIDPEQFMTTGIADKIRDAEEWHRQFEAIDDFRRLNKLYPGHLMKHLSAYT